MIALLGLHLQEKNGRMRYREQKWFLSVFIIAVTIHCYNSHCYWWSIFFLYTYSLILGLLPLYI